MNWRLMRYWSSLRGDEPYARISEFNVEAVPGFGPHAFMLDLHDGPEDPLVRFVGQSLSQECGRNMTGKRLSEVPDGSLLARVATHYRDVQVAKAPFEFADEYINESKEMVLYRGIMLPFTRGGRSIDYIVGAITNKKEATDGSDSVDQVDEADTQQDDSAGLDAQALLSLVKSDVESGTETEADTGTAPVEPETPPLDIESLTSSLDECQALARKIEAADARSRKALYETLDKVYSFAFEAEADPGGFQALLDRAGLTRQDRAPFTPIVKLVFGADYNKTRLSEYEAALGYARRQGLDPHGFRAFIEQQPGGLKGCVAAERTARRAERGERVDKVAQAKERLRALDPIASIEEVEPGTEEFVLMLGRRGGAKPGAIDVIALLDEKQALLDGILKRAAKGRRKPKAKPKKSLFDELDLEISGDRSTGGSLVATEEAADALDLQAAETSADVSSLGADSVVEDLDIDGVEERSEQVDFEPEVDSLVELDLDVEDGPAEELELSAEDRPLEESDTQAPSLEERAADMTVRDTPAPTETSRFSTDLDEIEVEVSDVDQAT